MGWLLCVFIGMNRTVGKFVVVFAICAATASICELGI